MESFRWGIDTYIKDTPTFINIQDRAYDLKEETSFVPIMEDSHDNVDNPKEDNPDKDEELGGWEDYIEYVNIRVATDNFDTAIKKSNIEKMFQDQKDLMAQGGIQQLIADASGQSKYKCNERNCGKTYSAKWDANNHCETKHKGQAIKCINCEKNFSKRSNMLSHMKNKICLPRPKLEIFNNSNK